MFKGIFNEKRKILILLLICVIAMLTMSMLETVNAKDITIGPNTPGGLKKAIEIAKNGSTIYMENGVYVTQDNWYSLDNESEYIDKNLTIKGKGKHVVIDGQKKHDRLFKIGKFDRDSWTHIQGLATLTLVNLKIMNFIKNNTTEYTGVIIQNGDSLIVNNCIFSDNTLWGAWGGSIIRNGDLATKCNIINSTFINNDFSGSIHVGGGISMQVLLW